jgi:lipase chaperone LimK
MKRFALFGVAALIAALLISQALAPSHTEPRAPDRTRDSVRQLPAIRTTSPEHATSSPALQTTAPKQDEIADLRDRLGRSSLRGSSADGEVSLDLRGRVVADAGLRRLFDWYLSLSGEFSDEQIRRLLLDDVNQALGAAVASDVGQWFERYLGLRSALAATRLSEDLDQRLVQVQALRRHWLGAAADAMFGGEEGEIAHTLARRALARDPTLSDPERVAQQAALDAHRSDRERTAEQEATAAVLAAEQLHQFERLGLDPQTRHGERSALWGEAAANRLAALDESRAQWQQRLSDYARQRERLLSDPALLPAEREHALSHLRRQSFDDLEQRRIEALEAIGALHNGG